MRRGTGALVALIGLAGVAIHLYAQSGPSSTPTQVTQTSYLKASNPDSADHFGCGGVLQGHTGQGTPVFLVQAFGSLDLLPEVMTTFFCVAEDVWVPALQLLANPRDDVVQAEMAGF